MDRTYLTLSPIFGGISPLLKVESKSFHFRPVRTVHLETLVSNSSSLPSSVKIYIFNISTTPTAFITRKHGAAISPKQPPWEVQKIGQKPKRCQRPKGAKGQKKSKAKKCQRPKEAKRCQRPKKKSQYFYLNQRPES